MQIVRHKSDICLINNRQISKAIENTISDLEQSYDMDYDATQLGWFLVCESEQDLMQQLPTLTFSLNDKLNRGEVEYVNKQEHWYEVYILLNDNEGILIYVPHQILEQHKITAI